MVSFHDDSFVYCVHYCLFHVFIYILSVCSGLAFAMCVVMIINTITSHKQLEDAQEPWKAVCTTQALLFHYFGLAMVWNWILVMVLLYMVFALV